MSKKVLSNTVLRSKRPPYWASVSAGTSATTNNNSEGSKTTYSPIRDDSRKAALSLELTYNATSIFNEIIAIGRFRVYLFGVCYENSCH